MKDSLLVSEIFESIIGESSFSGYPALFIRLSGCNLRCRWCDTDYAWEGGQRFTFDDIFNRVHNSLKKYILITGGEPLLQEATVDLVLSLNNKRVIIETNGTIAVPEKLLDQDVYFVVDVKTPSSGYQGDFNLKNIDLIRISQKGEFKFVIKDKNDFDWSVKFIKEHDMGDLKMLFSPCTPYLDPRLLVDWILALNSYNIRLNLQIHRIIGIK